MTSRVVRWWLLPLALGALACERDAGDDPAGEPDTLAIEIPAGEVEDRVQEGARRIGGRIGEALEDTGEAIERAGERIQQETAEPDTAGGGL